MSMSVVETEQAIQSILGDAQVEVEEQQMVEQYLDPGPQILYHQAGGDGHQQVRTIIFKGRAGSLFLFSVR